MPARVTHAAPPAAAPGISPSRAAAAVAGEYPDIARWLVFTWDGTGYGEDGTLWGGEALLGTWRMAARGQLPSVPFTRRRQGAREPWRSALALCREADVEWPAHDDTALLLAAWRKRLNTPQSSAVGRLSDAAAALTGINTISSFEGQGPMLLAACQARPNSALPLGAITTASGKPTGRRCCRACSTISGGRRAPHSFTPASRTRSEQARQIRAEHGNFCVGLTGGVFRTVLTELALHGSRNTTLTCASRNGYRAMTPASASDRSSSYRARQYEHETDSLDTYLPCPWQRRTLHA
jgi:hydrogenase maturation protein HypF